MVKLTLTLGYLAGAKGDSRDPDLSDVRRPSIANDAGTWRPNFDSSREIRCGHGAAVISRDLGRARALIWQLY